MATTEVLRIKRKLDDTQDASQLGDMLRALEKEEVTLDVLRSTKIGISVSKLRRHEDPVIAAAARALVTKWKSVVPASRPGTNVGPRTPRSTASDSKAAQLSPPASSAPALVCKPIPRLSSTRNVAREKLFEVLAASPAADDTLHTLVDEIEAAVFEQNGADEGSKPYKAKVLQLRANLDKNCELRDRVVTGEVPANGLVNMSVDELATREKQKERERQRQEKFEEMQSDWLVKNDMKIRAKIGIGSEGMFKCARCGSKRTNVDQKQTRSADEPMTLFIMCLDCSKRWRM